ncbi:MAG: hypothetical protein ACYS8Y_13405, partial [Planctomycetota bacterium]
TLLSTEVFYVGAKVLVNLSITHRSQESPLTTNPAFVIYVGLFQSKDVIEKDYFIGASERRIID